MLKKQLLLLLVVISFAVPIYAQDAPATDDSSDESLDEPLILPIDFDEPVSDTISERAIFDWWTIELVEGDQIEVQMAASDGLEPLIGILNPDRELMARSDMEATPVANDVVAVTYEVPSDGEYTLVATRAGNLEGTSTGSYSLVVSLVFRVPERENDRIPVEFRCGEDLVTTALFFEPADEFRPLEESLPFNDQARLRITVIGLDDFQPLIRLQSLDNDPVCYDLPPASHEGYAYDLPGLAPDGGPDVEHIVEAVVTQDQLPWALEGLQVTIGSKDGQPGRYIALVEGMSLEDREDVDWLNIRRGPLARNAPTSIYMVATSLRFDPYLTLLNEADTVFDQCDDAGRGDCDDMPSIEDKSLTLSLGEETAAIVGQRFDAGIMLEPDRLEVQQLRLESRSHSTRGSYAILIMGELPTEELPASESE